MSREDDWIDQEQSYTMSDAEQRDRDGWNDPPAPLPAEVPHDYESPRGMAEPILECAVCGQLRSAPIHSRS